METPKKFEPVVITSTKSVISDKERRLMELINGAEPIDESEKRMVQEIKEIEDKGHVIWIPSD